jgi:hypothetical protein
MRLGHSVPANLINMLENGQASVRCTFCHARGPVVSSLILKKNYIDTAECRAEFQKHGTIVISKNELYEKAINAWNSASGRNKNG